MALAGVFVAPVNVMMISMAGFVNVMTPLVPGIHRKGFVRGKVNISPNVRLQSIAAMAVIQYWVIY